MVPPVMGVCWQEVTRRREARWCRRFLGIIER